LRFCYLSYLSKPISDRLLYRVILRRRYKSILECGIGAAVRALRMIEAATFHVPPDQVQYTGIDLFEARGDSSGGNVLLLKEAHRLLKATGARIRLLPGDPFSALARAANTLLGTDLVVISADQDPRSVAHAWYYLPRLLHCGSQVYLEEAQRPGKTGIWRLVPPEELEALASARRRQVA
jgi:hypothetical protein